MKTLTLAVILGILAYNFTSCSKDDETDTVCRLTKVQGGTWNMSFGYDESYNISSFDEEGIDNQRREYTHNSNGQLISVLAWMPQFEEPRYWFTYNYTKNGELKTIRINKNESGNWSEKQIISLYYEDGNLYRTTTTLRGDVAFEIKFLDYKNGNYHRKETYRIEDGQKSLSSYVLYDYDQKRNPYFKLGNDYFYTSPEEHVNQNNVIEAKVFKSDTLFNHVKYEYEYHNNLPISLKSVHSVNQKEYINTYEYECFE